MSGLREGLRLGDHSDAGRHCIVRDSAKAANKRTKLTQTQYIKDVLERVGMTGATPISTPMEPNAHLTVADCPSDYNCNKEFVREYQRSIGDKQPRVQCKHAEAAGWRTTKTGERRGRGEERRR
eukprot:2782318-Rhodomonas_salina.1